MAAPVRVAYFRDLAVAGPLHVRLVDIDAAPSSAARAAVSDLVGAAPAALNTLVEIATALGNDADLAGTLTSRIAATEAVANAAATSAGMSTLQGRVSATEAVANAAATSAAMSTEVTAQAARDAAQNVALVHLVGAAGAITLTVDAMPYVFSPVA